MTTREQTDSRLQVKIISLICTSAANQSITGWGEQGKSNQDPVNSNRDLEAGEGVGTVYDIGYIYDYRPIGQRPESP